MAEETLHPTELTWIALLGQWLDFARASVALPDDSTGQRWRASIAPIINLQAVTFALGQLDDLPADERALGLDRAEILIRKATADLNDAWHGEAIPPLVLELMEDAGQALAIGQAGPFVEFRVPGAVTDCERWGLDAAFEMPLIAPLKDWLADSGFTGVLRAAAPGTLLVPGEPALHASGWSVVDSPLSLEIEGFTALIGQAVGEPEQVYRQMDDAGRIVADRLVPLRFEPPPGRPLLLAVLENGERVAGALFPDPERWSGQQRAAWPDGGLLVYPFKAQETGLGMESIHTA